MYGQNNFYGGYAPFYNGDIYKQPYQPIKQTNEMIWVLNENEATSYPVAPNNTVILWDKNNPTIYVKSADMQGVPSIRVLDFTERSTPANAPKNAAEYVKHEDFKVLQEQFAELASKVETITKEGSK